MRPYLNYTKTTLLVTILMTFLGSCGGFVIEKKVVGNYYLIAVDVIEDISLSHHKPSDGGAHAEVIPPTVFAVGHDDRYIIAKRHSLSDRTNIDYYIVPVKADIDWRSGNYLIGPLTLEQFEQKRRELNIQSMRFTISYKDLE
jgi:hypothetical protein